MRIQTFVKMNYIRVVLRKLLILKKTKAIDLLTETFDFEKLELCQNSNLH